MLGNELLLISRFSSAGRGALLDQLVGKFVRDHLCPLRVGIGDRNFDQLSIGDNPGLIAWKAVDSKRFHGFDLDGLTVCHVCIDGGEL